MSIARLLQDSPLFVNGMVLSATDLEVMRLNLAVLNQLTQRGRDILQTHSPRTRYDQSVGTSYEPEFNAYNPLDYWGGGIRYRTGMTTLTILLHNTLAGGALNEVLRIRINGVNVQDTALIAGDQTIIHPLGAYTDNTILSIELLLVSGESVSEVNPWGTYHLRDLYVSPVGNSMSFAWGGVPTFGDLSSSNMNQLSNAIDWLSERVGLMPIPMFQSMQNGTGLYWINTRWGIMAGSMVRGHNDRLNVTYRVAITTTESEQIRLMRDDNTQMFITDVLTPGQRIAETRTIDISALSASTPFRLELQSVVNSDPPEGETGRPSRYTVDRIWLSRSSITPIALPSSWTPDGSLEWSVLQGQLNQLATAAQDIYTRIASNEDDFNRIRPYRRNFGDVPGEREYWDKRYVGRMGGRTGRLLIVKGRNVKLLYGGIRWMEPTELDGDIDFEGEYQQTIIGGDGLETKIISLNTLDGLLLGRSYYLRGEVEYAAEVLR
jgi:hypothetical protein